MTQDEIRKTFEKEGARPSIPRVDKHEFQDEKEAKLRSTLIMTAVLVAMLAGLFLGAFVMRSCSPPPIEIVPEPGIDAGPGEEMIAAELDAALQREEEEIRALEEAHRRELDAFDERQREEYERARAGGRAEVARWLNDFNRSMKDAGAR